MNKSLETEYKDLVRIDLPDLWGKIEEKLDAQEAAEKTNVVEFPKTVTMAQNDQIDKKEKLEKIFADHPETVAAEKNAVPLKKKKRSIPWQYFGVAAAAVLCMLVVIPVMSTMRQSGTSAAPAAASTTGNAMTAAPAAADMAVETEMAEASTESEYESAYLDRAAENSSQSKRENGAASYSVSQGSHPMNTETLGAETQSALTVVGDCDAAEETESEDDASFAEELEGVPSAAYEEEKACFLLSTVGEDVSEKQLTQMMDQLRKDMDPNLSLVLQKADEQEIYEQNDRFTHVMILSGDMTEEQRKEEVDRILQELQNYEFISIRDVQLSED